MSTIPVLIPVEEYLRTVYRPDCDYIDGQIKERNMGELPHGKLQAFFSWFFRNHRGEWRVIGVPEQRVQVSALRYRIPDICLISHDSPEELILRTPPVLCIEILSREDRMSEIQERIEDYLAMGVPCVWVVDPWRRKAYAATGDGILHPEPETLRVPQTAIAVPVREIFAELDSQRN
jgi:Uma2 family endonuclease